MPGLMNAGGDSKKGKFLGFGVAVNNEGNIYYDVGSKFYSGRTFKKSCRVHVVAFTWASNDHQNVNVQLSGVGELISAWDYDLKYLRYVHNVYNVSPGQTFTCNASGNYYGVSGFVTWIEK